MIKPSTLDQLCTELEKDPDFLAEYHRQRPYYDLLVAVVKHCGGILSDVVQCSSVERLVQSKSLKTSLFIDTITNARGLYTYYDADDDSWQLTIDPVTMTIVHYLDDHVALLYEPHDKEVVGFRIEAFRYSPFAQPFDGYYNSTESGHPKPSTLPAPDGAPLFRDRIQHDA